MNLECNIVIKHKKILADQILKYSGNYSKTPLIELKRPQSLDRGLHLFRKMCLIIEG